MDLERIINGRLVRVWRRRSAVEAFVWPGATAEGEPLSEWVLPVSLRYDLEAAAEIAYAQTPKE